MMKKKTKIGVWALMCVCQAFWVSASGQEELFTTLQKTPWEAKSMQALQTVMRNERESVAIRSRAMALCTLSLLRLGNTNQFVKASHVLDVTFPSEKGLITVSVAENVEDCSACSGKGRREVPCPACKGKACLRCKGTRVMQTTCTLCMGAKQQFKLSPAVQENYNRLLKESVDICQKNLRFEKDSASALAEKDNTKKIVLLEAVLSNFPERTDLVTVQKSLEEAKKIRENELDRKKEKVQREKEEREVARLEGLREVSASECAAAILEIETYLLKNPKCTARADLEELKAVLTSKVNLRQRLISSALWLVGICGGFAFLVFLKGMIFSKKIERSGPLPGMARIDKNKFTDPLAEEREKNQTRSNQEGH
jgi:hypothetical protein